MPYNAKKDYYFVGGNGMEMASKNVWFSSAESFVSLLLQLQHEEYFPPPPRTMAAKLQHKRGQKGWVRGGA